MFRYVAALILPAVAAMYSPAGAGEADVLAVEIARTAPGVYRFDVTVRHADSGWDHYADRWEVRDAGGAVLATRVLLHPHVAEQPFTRSLGGVRLAQAPGEVTVAIPE